MGKNLKGKECGKPMHCEAVLNRMETTYAGSTIDEQEFRVSA